jgi:hypothetical protein
MVGMRACVSSDTGPPTQGGHTAQQRSGPLLQGLQLYLPSHLGNIWEWQHYIAAQLCTDQDVISIRGSALDKAASQLMEYQPRLALDANIAACRQGTGNCSLATAAESVAVLANAKRYNRQAFEGRLKRRKQGQTATCASPLRHNTCLRGPSCLSFGK